MRLISSIDILNDVNTITSAKSTDRIPFMVLDEGEDEILPISSRVAVKMDAVPANAVNDKFESYRGGNWATDWNHPV